jgi:iron complex outermembrane receptor protein
VNHYGTINQPKLSAVVTRVKGLSVYGNYGRTFQIRVGPAGYKIPPQVNDLDPSVKDGWEGGVKFGRGSWLEGRLAVWRQTASGEVHLQQFTNDFANVGKTKREGFDLEATVNGSRYISVWTAFSKQRGEVVVPDPSTPEERGNLIDHVPAYLTSGGIDVKPTPRLRLSLLGNAQSKYELDTSNTHGRFGDFVLFNAEVAYRVNEKVEISGQVKNLANRRYEYVWWDGDQTLHAPGDNRTFYVSVRVPLVSGRRP